MPKLKTEKKKKVAYNYDHQISIEKKLKERVIAGRRNSLVLYRAYMMVAETGMRINEIRTLKLNRIDLIGRIIKVRSVPEVDMTIKEGKEKNVPISNYLLEFLKRDLLNRKPDEVWYLDSGIGSIYYAKPESLSRAFTLFLIKHELYNSEIKPFHGFRSMVISKIIELKGIGHAKNIAGYTDIATTAEYVDVDFLDLQESVNTLRIPSREIGRA